MYVPPVFISPCLHTFSTQYLLLLNCLSKVHNMHPINNKQTNANNISPLRNKYTIP